MTDKSTWIPVTKAVPEEYERVLVWIEYRQDEGVGHMYGFSYHVEDIWYGDAFSKNRKVLAWMPLPPAYKGGVA